jgi:hypothetical protein
MTSEEPSAPPRRQPHRQPHETHSGSSSPQSQYHYPAVPLPQHPQAARLSPIHPTPSNRYGADAARVHASFSSAESGATLTADYKAHHPSHKQYHFGPMMEAGIREESTHKKSPSTSHFSDRVPYGSQHATSPVIEDNSAIYQYIQEKSHVADEEERTDDHALWVLV